jgi:post-segregation antitoxin (ccd killing protein)
MGYVTVSAKIPRELREKLRELGIKPSKVIRKALQDEVERKMNEKLRENLEKASGIMRRIEAEDWVRAVRETRDER